MVKCDGNIRVGDDMEVFYCAKCGMEKKRTRETPYPKFPNHTRYILFTKSV